MFKLFSSAMLMLSIVSVHNGFCDQGSSQSHGSHMHHSGGAGKTNNDSHNGSQSSSNQSALKKWDGPTNEKTITFTADETVKLPSTNKLKVTLYALKKSSKNEITVDLDRPILTLEGKNGERTLTVEKGKVPVMKLEKGAIFSSDADGKSITVEKAGNYFGGEYGIKGMSTYAYGGDGNTIELYIIHDELSETYLPRSRIVK